MANLTKQHYKRLRHYWKGRGGRAGSATDNIDLDLTAADLINRCESHGVVYFEITKAGEKELAAEKECEIARRAPHHTLANRIAIWLQEQGRVTWENIELRVDLEGAGRQAIRPDVFSMAATYNEKRINPCVHEVKISRADFLADLANPAKRLGYAKVAEVVYYAAPLGMIQLVEVPPECGLLVELEQGKFEIAKRPKKQLVKLSTHHFMNLILKSGNFTSAR